jgi:hypothetical protein
VTNSVQGEPSIACASLFGMAPYIIKGEGAPPGRADALDIVHPATPQGRAHMDDGDAERAHPAVKGVDRRDDVSRAGRRAWALGRGIEMGLDSEPWEISVVSVGERLPAETTRRDRLRGWGGRIRNFAFRMIVSNPMACGRADKPGSASS